MDVIDRRQYKRHQTEILASLYTEDETIPATITDIGAGGFGMVLNQTVPQGTQVMVELKFLGEYAIQGMVVWSSQVLKGRHAACRIGFEAESIIWTDLKSIAFPKWDDLIGKIITEAISQ